MDSARQIENLLYRYAELIDSGDYAGIGQLFAHAEIIDEAGNLIAQGPDGIAAMYHESTRLYPETGTPLTKHVTTNAIIEVDEAAGTATARSYYTVLQRTDQLALQPIITGRYHDAFVQAGDNEAGWRFSQRKMIIDQLGDLSQHLLISVDGAGDTGGADS